MSRDRSHHIAGRLKETPIRERVRVIEELAKMYGISARTVRRLAVKGGFDFGRPRNDSKQPRELPTEKLEQVSRIIHATGSKKYPPKLSTERAIRLAVQNGICAPGELTARVVNQYLRAHAPRLNAHALQAPHIPRRPDHVNQVGQFDVSNCAQWYLENNGGIGSQDPSIYWTKNKRGKGPAIKRAIYVEVATGSFYVEYFCGEESITDLLPILWRAWMLKESEDKYPLKGMPDILIADKGSGLKNSYCDKLFENLEIDFRPHAKGNPRAKGAVETLMFYAEREIESLLKFDPASSIEDLNRKIRPMLIELNGVKIHSRHNMTRSAAFSSYARREHLRLPPRDLDYFLGLAHRKFGAIVSSQLSVRFKGNEYSFLGDAESYSNPAITALKGQKVTVMHCPFDKDRVKIVTKDGRAYYPAKVVRDALGYPSFAVRIKTPAAAPKLARPTWQVNIERMQTADPPRLEKVFSNDDLLDNLRFITRPAQEFSTEGIAGGEGQIFPAASIPRLEAKKRLQELLGRKLTRDESTHLNNVWSELVSKAEIENMLDELQPQKAADQDMVSSA